MIPDLRFVISYSRKSYTLNGTKIPSQTGILKDHSAFCAEYGELLKFANIVEAWLRAVSVEIFMLRGFCQDRENEPFTTAFLPCPYVHFSPCPLHSTHPSLPSVRPSSTPSPARLTSSPLPHRNLGRAPGERGGNRFRTASAKGNAAGR